MKTDQPIIFDREVTYLRDMLISLAEEIAAKYSDGSSGKRVIDLLMENLCERCIIERLKAGYSGDEEIDRVWRNLHEYAVSLLVERLKNELFNGFRRNAYAAIERAVEAVITELARVLSSEKRNKQ